MVLLLAAQALAHEPVLPDRRDGPWARATWMEQESWRTSPPEPGGGSRVAALVEVADTGPEVGLEARGRDGNTLGPWLPLEETFRGDGHRVYVVDLGRTWPEAQLRLPVAHDARVGELGWDLLTPRFPEAGRQARALAAAGPKVQIALEPLLSLIGVVDRNTWGARPTTCSTPETDWYRMAIHHTAGSQTSGGTVQGAVQALQAYAQDSGTYCDIPYQFLVGYDGSLWEGRELIYYSGATGGGNNDGNIAVCFLGCYHPSSCPGGAGSPATDEMIGGAQLLVQTLVELHAIPSDADSIRGHRDWPDNATACPGDYVHDRLDELRTDLAWFGGEEVARSADPRIVGDPGAEVEVWVELENTGGLPWEPGATFLGTTGPRDASSALQTGSWVSPIRAATVDATTGPGEVGRFAFSVAVPATGEVTQGFGLVQEFVTWFGDAPWGGGPEDDFLVLTVAARDATTLPGVDTGTLATGADTAPPDTPSLGGLSARVAPEPRGCGCAVAPGPGIGGLALVGLVAGWQRARRRGAASRPHGPAL